MPLVEKLRPFCDRWAPGEPALIGVSGGVDSVVLLDVLTRIEFAKLVVCHLHHGLRGAEAEADEAFVRGLAAQVSVRLRTPPRGRGGARRGDRGIDRNGRP